MTKNQGLIPKNNQLNLDEYLVNSLNNLNQNSSKFEIKGALYTICGIFERKNSYKTAIGMHCPKRCTFTDTPKTG